MNERFFKTMKPLQTRISNLYDKGVLSVNCDYVQVTDELFKEIIKDHDGLHFCFLDDPEYDFEASISVCGVKYLTIATFEEFEALGIPVPERE